MAVTNLPRVPEGLRDLVKTYTKEVLREKPKDLYKFSVDYFESLAGTRKIQRKVIKYETQQSYETIVKNRIRQQVPLSLAFHIIPENLTEVIKQFIKAVLRENPQYLVPFAIEYFKNLQTSSSKLGDIQYTAYEKFMEKNESQSPARKVTTCECGRILSSTGGTPEVVQNIPDVDQQIGKLNKNDQYIRAVCIIQKYFRQYLKQKAEKLIQLKVTSKTTDFYCSQEVLNAIIIIQRQFRRLLTKKRSKTSAESKQTNEGRYNSVKYMRAVLIIQRYMREYLRNKKSKKQTLTKSEDLTPDDNITMTTAAFVIQRAFRSMVRARRAKGHINADLDQCDEMNDNASEAASYTSASTALLSTESAGEHDFGSTHYEEGVHQQTIKEDEEVENGNTNRQMIFGTESINTNTNSENRSRQGKKTFFFFFF
ncbi:uncharacterized protein LOC115563966 [Drosophila navojoa]|uniref:uncharacterized protein LOC115563966 n=1 Tax=Drosophila navojoa TaxID=7232 RepID=UPI0011BEB720|nr:uncharacterized protein LOC115563966 [Drosophila navojoa]